MTECWRVRMPASTAAGGTRRIALYARTKSELLTKIERLRFSASRGVTVPKERMTTGAFLDRWLNDSARPRIRPSTYSQYESLIRLHIKPAIGAIELTKLGASEVQAMLSAMEGQGASGRVRQLALIVLKAGLQQGLRWDLVFRNVAQNVDKPRVPKRSMTVLTAEQADQFLAAAEQSKYYALYVLALTTGMRRGELFALKWDDVDLDAEALSVRGTLTHVGGAPTVTEPKTSSGRRRIELPAMAVDALRNHRKALMAHGLRASPWVFPCKNGNPLDAHNVVHRSFHPLLKTAGLPRIRFHDLRHTAATLMLLRGLHPKVVQERLGHGSIAITMDTYSHVLPSMQKEAAESIDALFAGLRAQR